MVILMYIGFSCPHGSKSKNKLEYFNEGMIGIITIQFCTYTDWFDGEETKFNFGWCMIMFVLILIVINLAIVFYYIGRSFYLVYRKYKNVYDEYRRK